jgi:hypothetical protein
MIEDFLKYVSRKFVAELYNELFECDDKKAGENFVKGIEYGITLRKKVDMILKGD